MTSHRAWRFAGPSSRRQLVLAGIQEVRSKIPGLGVVWFSSRMTMRGQSTLEEVVAAVRANQKRYPGSGFTFSEPAGVPYIQWVLKGEAEPPQGALWALTALEVGILDNDQSRADILREAGFVESNVEVDDITLWEPADLSEVYFESDAELQTFMVKLARILGAEDGQGSSIFP